MLESIQSKKLAFTILACMAGVSFATVAVAHADASTSSGDVTSPLSPEAQAQFHVMAGEMAAGRQMPAVAAQEFLKALDFVSNPTLAARATAFALAAKRDDLALAAARKWLSIDGSSMDAREVITRISLKTGNTTEALAQCEAMVKGHPGGEGDGYRHVALLLAQDRDTPQASLALMKLLVAGHAQSAAAQRALALLAFRFDDLPTAEKSAREALRLAPNERESTLLLVATLIRKGDLPDADQAMEGLLKDQKDPRDLRLGYAKLLIESDQRVAARDQLERVLKLDPGNADAHFALGLLALDDRNIAEAEPHFTLLLDNPDRKSDAAYYLGRIAELRKQPQAALGWYEKVTGGSQVLDSYLHRARMLADLHRLPEARELLEALRAQYPPLSSRLLATEGELLISNEAYLDALSLYDNALKASPDDDELLYARALVHERMSRFDLAEADLRKVIAANAKDARSLNALGYLLTLHTNRIDEALKLITAAYEISPSDPAIIDSMGWVIFKQGRPKEALGYLQKAYGLLPDPEVAAHLGEVLWTLGEKDKARAVLDAAGKDDPGNRILRDTQQRLLGR